MRWLFRGMWPFVALLVIVCGETEQQQHAATIGSPERVTADHTDRDSMFLPLSETVKQDGWVDPFDMFGDTREISSAASGQERQNDQNEGFVPRGNVGNDDSQLELVRGKLERNTHSLDDESHFRKFIQNVLVRLKETKFAEGKKNLYLSIPHETELQWSDYLKSSQSSNMHIIHDSLMSSIRDEPMAHPLITVMLGWMATTDIWPYVGMAVGVCGLCFVQSRMAYWHGCSWQSAIRSLPWLFVCFFVASIPWEWMRMYRVLLAEKMATLQQSIPGECFPERMSTWTSLSFWFSTKVQFNSNACLKYHEQMLVNPFLKVSPIKVLSVVLTSVVLEPLSYVADVTGNVFVRFFAKIPLMWQPFVFSAFVFLFVLFVMFAFGIRISTLFGSIQIGGHPTPVVYGVQDIRQQTVLPSQQTRLPLPNATTAECIPDEIEAQVPMQKALLDTDCDDENRETFAVIAARLLDVASKDNDVEATDVQEVIIALQKVIDEKSSERNKRKHVQEKASVCRNNAVGGLTSSVNKEGFVYIDEEDNCENDCLR